VADETVGILNLSDKSSGEPFTERDLSVLAPFAVQASMLLKLSSLYSASERMRELSITDSLTGLFNRRYFDARIDEEFQRAKRYGLFFSLAIMDIDDFKVLNDTEGHMAGDQVLKEIAQVMSGTIRSNDILVRFGGEEFAIIMPQTSKEESFNVVERIRKSVYSLMFQAFKKLPGRRLTISAGIAMYPDGGDSIESLIVNADRALYQAKSQGKNRSIIWDRGEPSANVQTARGKKK
jgi:diguanylate cyclase (GGDEF)-like protein